MSEDLTRCSVEECHREAIKICKCIDPPVLICEDHLDQHKNIPKEHTIFPFYSSLNPDEREALNHYKTLLTIIFLNENSLDLFMSKEKLKESRNRNRGHIQVQQEIRTIEESAKKISEAQLNLINTIESKLSNYKDDLKVFKDVTNEKKGVPHIRLGQPLIDEMVRAKEQNFPISKSFIKQIMGTKGYSFPADTKEKLKHFFKLKKAVYHIGILHKNNELTTSVYANTEMMEEFSKYIFDADNISAEFLDPLIHIVKGSKHDRNSSVLAANVITLLTSLGVGFKDQDFSGIQIPGADLSNACLANTNFEGANLRNVNLTSVFLANANFNGCMLEGAELGLVSFIDDTSPVSCVKFIPNTYCLLSGTTQGHINYCSIDGSIRRLYSHEAKIQAIEISSNKFLASLCKKGDLILYNLNTWEKVNTSEKVNCVKTEGYALCFSPKGDILYVGGKDGSIWRYFVAQKKMVKVRIAHSCLLYTSPSPRDS